MNSKHTVMACAAALCGSVYAYAESTGNALSANNGLTEPNGTQTMASFNDGSGSDALGISGELSIDIDSKFTSYGLVNNRDPILSASAEITFLEHITLSATAIFDLTQYGRKHGEYGNREGRYTELDPGISFSWDFSPNDYPWLPTTISTSLGYSYEYHPHAMGSGTGEPGEDSHFITAEISLPDLWIEPVFSYERDVDRDNGTYLKLEFGHTFTLIDGTDEEDDPTLSFRPSLSQGFGNAQRTRSSGLAEDHAGMMDFCLKGDLTWKLSQNLTLSGYVAYYDYIFDTKLRNGARDYEASGRDNTPYHFITGISLAASF